MLVIDICIIVVFPSITFITIKYGCACEGVMVHIFHVSSFVLKIVPRLI